MADQRDEADRKGAHCAWQIHYHIVFPVKYRRSLLDEMVTTIIQETAAEIAERFPIEMEAIGTDQNHIHLLCSAHPKVAPGRIVQIMKLPAACCGELHSFENLSMAGLGDTTPDPQGRYVADIVNAQSNFITVSVTETVPGTPPSPPADITTP